MLSLEAWLKPCESVCLSCTARSTEPGVFLRTKVSLTRQRMRTAKRPEQQGNGFRLLNVLHLSLFCILLHVQAETLAAGPLFVPQAVSQESPSPPAVLNPAVLIGEPLNNEALAAKARPSLVFIRSTDRTGGELGLGAGFVIDPSGLIVTARHVIGDGRDFVVEMHDGKLVPVTEVYASSNKLDLAIIRVDAKELSALSLSPDDETAQGREVVAMGHPRGLRNSIASGLVSGHQEIDDVRMLQLAMSIEPGNSGGPVLDRLGNVVGIVTMKSTIANNVGFAIPVRLLRELITNPNPVPMERWRTIGALDSRQWQTVFGANWRQRAGRMTVNGQGRSFGGRTLCLRNRELPQMPFELQVIAKLEDERGAAGLVFHADGGDRHYGFYPSGGKLRITRFTGPEVDSWTILHDEAHDAYKPGEWNTLTVRIHPDRFECYVNGVKVKEITDSVLPTGKVGLAAFRSTEAEFRRFQIGESLLPSSLSSVGRAEVDQTAREIRADRPADEQVVEKLLPLGESAGELLNAEAIRLEQRAKRLRQLSSELHESAVRRLLAQVLQLSVDGVQLSSPAVNPDASAIPAATDDPLEAAKTETPDLLRAALLVAHMDNPDLDVDEYVTRLDEMAEELRQSFPEGATESQRLEAMDKYFFHELGVHGSQYEYEAKSNNYLNEVLDDREGLPITISVLYMELARRVDLKIAGIGLPGHFVVRFEPSDTTLPTETIDPFERGKRLSEDEIRIVMAQAGYPNEPQFREAKSPVQIVERMVRNLLASAERDRNDAAVLRYLETLVMLTPQEPEYRAKRLEMRARTGRIGMAIQDADWFIQNPMNSVNVEQVRQLRQTLEQQLEQQNGAE